MNKMRKKSEAQKYLEQIKEIDGDISDMIKDVERLRLIAYGTTAKSGGERVQSSSSKQKMADAVCEYVDIEEDIKRELGRLSEKRKEILSVIRRLQFNKRSIIHKRYVQGKSFDEIADMCDKSKSWVTSIHGRALQDVQAILDERKK